MQIEILAKNFKASDKLLDIVEKKLSKLDKYFQDDSTCKVCMKQEAKTCKTEVTIDYKGNLIRSEVASDNFYNNIDVVIPKIQKQIYKYKSKLSKNLRDNVVFDEKEFEEQESEVNYDKLVKTKKFEMRPMSVQHAIEELNLLGHSFYVFLDAETNQIRVIYRRLSGDIGMIVPEF